MSRLIHTLLQSRLRPLDVPVQTEMRLNASPLSSSDPSTQTAAPRPPFKKPPRLQPPTPCLYPSAPASLVEDHPVTSLNPAEGTESVG